MLQFDSLTNTQFNQDEIYSVSDFLSLCHSAIENNIPTCWLKGEISNLSCPASGHWYFSLKDQQGQIRCALFRFNQRHVKFTPENGMEVLVHVSPTLYQPRGDFQLVVLRIEPIGVGSLQVAFEQLKAKLLKQGLFDKQHKKSLPIMPTTIGVVSSSNGAVIQDIIKVLNKRYPFAEVLLYDCIVQGDQAAEKLSKALNAADQSNRCDVLILARGGGSLEDLWAFNEEILAKTIFALNTPIISAVGHETDTTIADFVADKRAPTPSAAAMMATPDRLDLLTKLNTLHTNLSQQIQYVLEKYQYQLEQLSLKIPKPSQQLNISSQKLDGLYLYLNHHAKTIINFNQSKLSTLSERLEKHSPSARINHQKALTQLAYTQLSNSLKHTIEDAKSRLLNLVQNLEKSTQNNLIQEKNRLSTNILGLEHLSPLNTLSRGYSITTSENNKTLHSAFKVKIGTLITTQLNDGKICSKVTKIKKN